MTVFGSCWALGMRLLLPLRTAIAAIRGRGANADALAFDPAFPHFVELSLPPDGLGSTFDEMLAFHRDRGIPHRRNEGRSETGCYVRHRFADPALAEAFRGRFGGERLTAARR
jgi:hypothetical protein